MKANFPDIHAAADYIGPGSIEVPIYQTEITDLAVVGGFFNASNRCRQPGIHRGFSRRPHS